jgi:hypothetical protein
VSQKRFSLKAARDHRRSKHLKLRVSSEADTILMKSAELEAMGYKPLIASPSNKKLRMEKSRLRIRIAENFIYTMRRSLLYDHHRSHSLFSESLTIDKSIYCVNFDLDRVRDFCLTVSRIRHLYLYILSCAQSARTLYGYNSLLHNPCYVGCLHGD